MSKANLTISLEKKDKEDFAELVQELGLNTSMAINMFIKQSIRNKELPLNLKIDDKEKIVEDILSKYDEAFNELAKWNLLA